MAAQLNGYYDSDGNFVDVVPRPVDRHSPNGIARITPKSSRHYAKLAYIAWVEGGMATPWDGTYTDDQGPQDLNYFDEP